VDWPYAGDMMMRLPQVKEMTGLSRSTIYNWLTAGKFPAPVKLGPRSVAWVRQEIELWVQTRISESRPQ
jgi:prophage regulatory protein